MQDGPQKTWSPCPRETQRAGPLPCDAPQRSPQPILRCRLLGRAEMTALRMPHWQEGFAADLTTFLSELLGLPPEAFALRVRHGWRGEGVCAQLSFGSCASPHHAELLDRSLRDGSLRRLVLRSGLGESSWPVSQVLRQFLLRDVVCQVFWVMERHEWRIPNFPRVAQNFNAVLESMPFDFGGGSNLTLHLHPNGSSHPGIGGSAALTLSAAGHGRPISPFLLTAGISGEIWSGPYGRDGANRFLAGGPLCSLEELIAAVDDQQTLLLAIEAVQSDAPDQLRQAWSQDFPFPRKPEPRTCRGAGEEAPLTHRPQADPEASPTAAYGAALLAAVEAATRCVDAMSAAGLQVPEIMDAVSTAQGKVEDLSGRMSALQRALRRRAQVPVPSATPKPPGDDADASASPAHEEPKDEWLEASLELNGTNLTWRVELSENSELPRCVFQETLASNLSTSTADFPDEDD
ncbi:unnamed protein product [Symbiodinium pilosum]|uniref:Uncharacterized protein n=1 Tax=Symbiodinium pilosum TaxID=2952 RepID=A0A812LYD4_SYMPI|nr:unnamed protein product [Symbiodinium pilosum]